MDFTASIFPFPIWAVPATNAPAGGEGDLLPCSCFSELFIVQSGAFPHRCFVPGSYCVTLSRALFLHHVLEIRKSVAIINSAE